MSNSQTFSCAILGEQSLVIPCAEALQQGGHEIRALVTNAVTIKEWAAEHGVLVVAGAEVIADRPVDYVFSIANPAALTPEVLAHARRGGINFHDAPLPEYAGVHAPVWALIRGATKYGITWHAVSDGTNEGHILKQVTFEISEDETSLTLNSKCYEAAIHSFRELVSELAAGTIRPQPQPLARRHYFGKYDRPKAGCTIDWSDGAEAISALVRALEFGRYANPLGLPKLCLDDGVLLVREVSVDGTSSKEPPGTVIDIAADGFTVATRTQDIVVRHVTTPAGQPIPIDELDTRFGLKPGCLLRPVDAVRAARLENRVGFVARHEDFWISHLSQLEPVEAPYRLTQVRNGLAETRVEIPLKITDAAAAFLDGGSDTGPAIRLLTAFGALLARTSDKWSFDVALTTADLCEAIAGDEQFLSAHVPLRFEASASCGFEEVEHVISERVTELRAHGTFTTDIVARSPVLEHMRGKPLHEALGVVVELEGGPPTVDGESPGALILTLSNDVEKCHWSFDPRVIQPTDIEALEARLGVFLESIAADASAPLGEVPLLSPDAQRRVLVDWNDTSKPVPTGRCVHQEFEQQVRRTPDRVALACGTEEITYRELNARANRLARYLQNLGTGPGSLVGVSAERSIEMVVGMLAIHKAGGAYVPIDPSYPEERRAVMLEDSRVRILLATAQALDRLGKLTVATVLLDDGTGAGASEPDEDVNAEVKAADPAYVIYTSGSTGRPKGVVVEHRNVIAFFSAMDDHIPHDSPGVWLAVTSLSFDISVLELLWTLARGFKVVIAPEEWLTSSTETETAPSGIEFSLAYFASDEGRGGPDQYRLLLEGAKFADRHEFAAVWTPERHFHAFGGPYPNPSVVSAAIAAVTERIGIRSGSVVLPLHNPIRVVEEWSVVDLLSDGRVGMSFASGWQPNDFVLAPDNFANRKSLLYEQIETVRRLWRGESVAFAGPHGNLVDVRTMPRPVQDELPIWVTTAGSVETYRSAGSIGANLLTHLLGQNVEELKEKIAEYRKARREAGHPGDGHVTLMLHTFVGDDDDEVRDIVRKPMIEYLRSSASLVKNFVDMWSPFASRGKAHISNKGDELAALSPSDMDALLEFAFGRYFETHGLFGSRGKCMALVESVAACGVDEIACLIDFGVDTQAALDHLEHLDGLRLQAERIGTGRAMDATFDNLVRHHRVTHFQCTPSMAAMLMTDVEARAALCSLEVMLVGGEALSAELAAELKQSVSGRLMNMYGPTETTIWSSCHTVTESNGTVPIGRPVANTQFYVLDSRLQPVPVGVAGELFIGGAGVTRGYLGRPELTAERFVSNPFADDGDSRLYRTGDRVRYHEDGALEFLGRTDRQVKVRGYRIELGEIEAVLGEHDTVRDCVVLARDDLPGGVRIVAYYVSRHDKAPTDAELKEFVARTLPEIMIPTDFIRLNAFPLTPNRKIDRLALPKPLTARSEEGGTLDQSEQPIETIVAEIWSEVLGLGSVGLNDNFFELGGNSLSTVHIASRIHSRFQVELPLRTFFAAPTVAGIAGEVETRLMEQTGGEALKELLDEIDGMSDQEVRTEVERATAGTDSPRKVLR